MNKKIKKKKLSKIDAGLIIFSLVLIVFVIVSIFINQQSKFKITKEECWNESCYAFMQGETITGIGFGIVMSDCIINFPKDCKETNISYFGEVVDFDCEGKIEVCEDVEVEEIILEDCLWIDEKKEKLYDSYYNLCKSNESELNKNCDLFSNIMKEIYPNQVDEFEECINNGKKQELSIEWLRANCEQPFEEIRKHKCGSYTVEVLN
ncbi:MAG: hypothetical protein ACP6IY_09555 [Promethearchaeia archaeon]